MSGKLGSDAFGFYVALGDDRSYSAVGEHFGVSKRAVVKAAGREGWASRLQEIEQEAREKADQKMTETLAEMLGSQGFATAAVVSHTLLSGRWGFTQGFDDFDASHGRGHVYVSTPGVTSEAMRRLDHFASTCFVFSWS